MNEPKAFKDQGLVEHSLNTVKIAMAFAKETYRCPVVKRLKIASRGKIDINESEAASLIKLVALLHDVGKASDYYQERFTKNAKQSSFSFHELPSAFIAYEVMKNAGYYNDKGYPQIILATLSIMNFHQAMRTLKDIDNCHIQSWSFKRWWNGMEPVFAASGFDKEAWKKARRDVIIRQDIKDLVRGIIGYISEPENVNWAKLYCLIQVPAIVGDMCDASHRKSENTHISVFRKEILGVCREIERA